MDFLITQFEQWSLDDFELLLTPLTDIKDKVRRSELIKQFKEILKRHAPEILETLKTSDDINRLLKILISEIKNTRSESSNVESIDNSIQYFALNGDKLNSRENVNNILKEGNMPLFVEIPDAKLTTLINDYFFPSTSDKPTEYEDKDILDICLEFEQPITFWSYFTNVPIDNIIPKIYYENDYNYDTSKVILPKDYPKLQDIEVSNYLQYTTSIKVDSQDFANILIRFNQKYGLPEPYYYVANKLEHHRYNGGLTIKQLKTLLSERRYSKYSQYFNSSSITRWAWDLVSRLHLMKTKGLSPLINMNLIKELINIIYFQVRYDDSPLYHLNYIFKISLRALSGKMIHAKGNILYHLSMFFTPSQLRSLYFDPKYQYVFRLFDQDYTRYNEMKKYLHMLSIHKLLEYADKFSPSISRLIFKDIIDKQLTTVTKDQLKSLLYDMPHFIINLPDDILSVKELNELFVAKPILIEYLNSKQLASLGFIKISNNINHDIINNSPQYKPDPQDIGLIIDSPQSTDFQSIVNQSVHNIYKQTPESIEIARKILAKTNETFTETELEQIVKDYFSNVPTIYDRRKRQNSKFTRWQPEQQSRQLSELENQHAAISSMKFELETDPFKVKEITDFFQSGVNGSQNYRIDKIYKVYNPLLQTRWKHRTNPSNNIINLWHGTNKQNLLAILENGLKLPDSEGMFGRGIYFAPLSIKSMRYSNNIRNICHHNVDNPQRDEAEGWLLYNQVDMGRVFYPTETGYTITKEFDSLYAKSNTLNLMMDEMVVYNSDRLLTTHLVKIKCEKRRIVHT